MNSGILGRLETVDLRKIWISEAGDFTPWLAREENLTLLGNTLGMDLQLDGQEKGVGPYRADIVCQDKANETVVLIENQLERTDHTHLGQLLTYAAGIDAVTIVWVAERFTEEHRAALDWLNEITGENISFFGLEIELWRIADSPVAPKFNIVSKPNDWTKGGTSGGPKGPVVITELKQLQQEYWRNLRELLISQKSKLNVQKAKPRAWLTIPIGRSYAHVNALIKSYEKQIGVELYIGGKKVAKYWYGLLATNKTEIEREFGFELTWMEMPEKDASRILVTRPGDFKNRAEWEAQHKWLAEMVTKFAAVFRPRVAALPDPPDLEDADEIDEVE